MMTAPQAFDLALRHHQAGRLAEAEALYRQILAVQPNHSEAWHFLGVVAYQMGRHDTAAALIRRAIALNPNNSAAYYNLGNISKEQRQCGEAIAAYRRAVELDGSHAEAHSNLGLVLASQNQFDAAIAAFRRALQINPNLALTHFNLGNALKSQRQTDEAIAAYRRAIELEPGYAEAHNNLGVALKERGQVEAAIAAYRQVLALKPDSAEAHNNLGIAFKASGQLEEAIAAYRQAIMLKPAHADAHNNLGNALKDQGHAEAAIAEYRRALELMPDLAAAYRNWGSALLDLGLPEEAIAMYRRALALRADDPETQSMLLFALHYLPGLENGAMGRELENWNRRFGLPARRFLHPHGNDRDPERRLRIGYVSPDFRNHVAGWNVLPLFACHEHRDFEIVCYSGVARPDEMTAEFQRRADRWRNLAGREDDAVAAMVREDGIDILVDLSQHTAGNRLLVFARQPAPVQVSFAGYPESTGVEAIEYRISDQWLECGMQNAERVFLLDSFWCYDPCGMEVAVNELPAEASGYITFGCLNNFCKVNEPVLRLWAQVLRGAPGSRLLMLSGLGSHRPRTIEFLEGEGIAPHRVEFVGRCARGAYLELYHRLDVVLDTFPYNGHTTSLDALWMGVPVVSRCGQRPVSRAGLSQLSNLGLPGLVAHSDDEYVGIATQLAGNLPHLVELRRTLRARMENSVLMDAPRFARGIEAAYRAMWRQWCEKTAR